MLTKLVLIAAVAVLVGSLTYLARRLAAKRPLRIYVASKFENKPLVRRVMSELESRGHVITANWTVHDATGLAGEELEEYLQSCALQDLDGVKSADIIFVIDHPACKSTYSELGIAVADPKKHIIVVGAVDGFHGKQNLFMHLPEVFHFDTIEQGLKRVDHIAAAA